MSISDKSFLLRITFSPSNNTAKLPDFQLTDNFYFVINETLANLKDINGITIRE